MSQNPKAMFGFLVSLSKVLMLTGCLIAPFSQAKTDIQYLPKDIQYDASIPLPESVLGSPVGTWHARHDQIVQYMELVAASSPRVQINEIGQTHENRKLLQLTISSQQNLENIEQIKQENRAAWQKTDNTNRSASPIIINMGYSVHGDEPSGANASLLIAYYLAAGQGPQVDALLENAVIVLDPVLNPDGLARFAQWANMHRGKNLVADANHREHQQDWPSGRTNHYWFDLNRDWLLLTHPESRARIQSFHEWRPHVLTDFHEMGSESTYFFQPGVPSRTNPWTPSQNVALTEKMAEFHAKTLDENGQLYFTEEAFDDFYYGKGSSYPDAHGTVGILFEQSSSRGHLRESQNGEFSFADTIQNQVHTSLSTFEGALALKDELIGFQKQFVAETSEMAKKDDFAGYLLTEKRDLHRFHALLNKLEAHQVEYFEINKAVTIDDVEFEALNSVFVPLEQPQYRLIKSLFSKRRSFKDNTFYDVSNWNIALSHNITYKEVPRSRWRRVSYDAERQVSLPTVNNQLNDKAVAYAFSWQESRAPAMLQKLLSEGFKPRISEVPFKATAEAGDIAFLPGAVILVKSQQPSTLELSEISRLGNEHGIKVRSLMSGLTSQGVDLGSRKIHPLTPISVLLVGGRDVSQYEAGEIWHYFDQQVDVPVSIVEVHRLANINLSKYSHIFLVDGSYKNLSEKAEQGIVAWVEAGGTIVGQKKGAKWLADSGLLETTFVEKDAIEKAFDTSTYSFSEQEQLSAKKRVAGAVYATETDLSHPLLFGFNSPILPLFKNSNLIMRKPTKPFVTVAQYASSPLMAGYSSPEIQQLIANTAAIVAHKKGQGRVIGLVDVTNFRGYWQGTNRLLSNALFLSHFIDVEG